MRVVDGTYYTDEQLNEMIEQSHKQVATASRRLDDAAKELYEARVWNDQVESRLLSLLREKQRRRDG